MSEDLQVFNVLFVRFLCLQRGKANNSAIDVGVFCMSVEVRAGFTGIVVAMAVNVAAIHSDQVIDQFNQSCFLLFGPGVNALLSIMPATDVAYADAVGVMIEAMRPSS